MLEQLQAKNPDAASYEDARAEFEDALAKIERAILNRLEQGGFRMPMFENFKQLGVAGNALLQILPKSRVKLHKLSNFVVKRDSAGNELEIIVLEKLEETTLPPAARALVEAEGPSEGSPYKDEEKPCELYTWVRRGDTNWTVHQEICGKIVPGTEGTYPLGKSPWLPLRFTAVDGEDYGRGYVEERIGHLRSLETLTQAMVEGTAIAAKVLFSVDESGVTSKKVIVESANGAVVDGNFEKDVKVLQTDKAADFSVAMQLRSDIKKDLERAFLLLSGVQRDAERVTAEEVRAVVAELETALGGFYSTLAQELQHPLVVAVMAQMQKEGRLPHLPEGSVAPQIVTGLDGLGRSSDLARIDALIDRLVKAIGPEGVAQRLSVDALASMLGTALSVDVKGLVRSDADMAKEAQAAQQAEIAKSAIGPGIKALSDHSLAAQQAPQEGGPTTS